MALIAFGAMATSLPVVWNTPYDGGYTADRAGWVVSVDQSGDAYAAGIRVGDRLTAVDGVPLRDVRGLYRDKGPGDTVRLSLERSGRTTVVEVPLSATPLSFRLLPLELLFVAMVFWAVGLAAWFLLPFDPTTRRFYLISQLVAFAFGVDFLARLRSPWLLALTDILLLLLAPMVLQFHSLFPEPMRSRVGRFLVGMAYAISLVLIVGVLVDWAVSDGIGAYRPLGDARDAHVLLTLTASIGVLVYRLWRLRSRSEQARRTGLVMAAGMTFGWLPFILFSALPHLFLGEPWLVYEGTVPFLAFWPLSFAYALVRGYLGRVERFVNRSLVFIATTGLLLLLLGAAWEGVARFPGAAQNDLTVVGFVWIAAIVYAHGRGPVVQFVNRLYGGWPSYEKVVSEASAKLSQAHELDGLVAGLARIADLMHFRIAVLFWPDGERLVSRGICGHGDESGGWCLHADGPLTRCLLEHRRPVTRDELVNLCASEADQWDRWETFAVEDERLRIWIPLVSRGRVQGILALGGRRGEELVDSEDLRTLQTVSRQAAVAADNVALVEELRAERDQLAEAQRQRTEIIDEERRHLAQDLHDGPVQDLVGVRQGLSKLEVSAGKSVARVKDLERRVREIAWELRATAGQLRAPALEDFGLAEALRSYLTAFAREYKWLEVQPDLMHDGDRLSDLQRTQLYRVCQQALRNVEAHADATRVMVRLRLDNECVSLEVVDDGRGFRVPRRWTDGVSSGHLGLLGMAERAERIGGTLEIESQPGEGTLVRIVTPLPGAPRDEIGEKYGGPEGMGAAGTKQPDRVSREEPAWTS